MSPQSAPDVVTTHMPVLRPTFVNVPDVDVESRQRVEVTSSGSQRPIDYVE